MSTTENSVRQLLGDAALASFRLNGQFLDLAETLARPVGLTAARWQVLGAVLTTPLPVAAIAREMGITRQSVQRTADLLVGQGLAEYRPNPAHRRAKLVAATPAGQDAVAKITPAHETAARRLCDEMGGDEFEGAVAALRRLSSALERLDESGERT
ncbi:MarR family winged helix-turn-helix transcriptional regulator [Rhodococcus coprophilus]|uniref:Transcriptional regulator SlyA n=1 Tax=Rhodococcus coprophilus TaxID=38310 RepID=A0A2X4WNH0_9NOCA|nr:MarR family transcriptional regulator [Rhodococcus coprophilus]MBM7460637.1 DNA-binding MarR family transcriptional regulator [Rhodococcus coprophilus]SQI28445.1 transcriptional regulator SlyA [Rhodococcus coprophilus]